MPPPLRRSGSRLLQNPRPGLLPSPTTPGLGPLDPLRELVSTRWSSFSVAACSYAPPRFDTRLSPDAGELASGLLWRFARAGLSPAGRLALLWALGLSKACGQ